LAEKAEVAKGTVLRAEHGEDVRPSSGRRIAKALGAEISELIPDKPERVGELAVPLAKAPREAGPPQVSRDELLAQGITATDDEVQELNNRLMLDWRWGQGEKVVSFFSPEDVNEARVGMLVHLALNTPSIVTPEAAGVVREGMRERLKA
jgi:transcriptional regulator with XRE-family HTH domain